ncbi:MAG: M23 family metallopeptidase [Myxococcota bacterium]
MSSSRTRPNDVVTFMYVPGESGSIRRVHVRRSRIRKATFAAVCALLTLAVLSVDYVRVRRGVSELEHLRRETATQRQQIQSYAARMEEIAARITNIDGLERKLRVITNLDPSDPTPLSGIGGVDGGLLDSQDLTWLSPGRRHQKMIESFDRLSAAGEAQTENLAALIAHLEDQTARLLATPSIAPTKGWVTSGFGYRTSPFTGNREFHRGLDIAGRIGTAVNAPANGSVLFVGRKRALGNTVVLRHGYRIETSYGHLSDVLVKPGQKVERGELIARMGTTGHSTGPHLHYQVEVNKKPVNPGNYILD